MTVSVPPSRPSAIADQRPEYGVYIVCLASYNNGHHYGAWIDLLQIASSDELRECIDWVLTTSPAPVAKGWGVHDHNNLPLCLSYRSDWLNLDNLVSYGKALQEIGDHAETLEAFHLYCDDRGEIVDVDTFGEAYSGYYDSGADFAQDLANDLGLIPEGAAWPLSYIDWEDAWLELEVNGEYTAEPSSGMGVHIFRCV